MTTQLTESQVSDAFHSYLKSSLAQAKAEHLLDEELLSSAEGDLMITGPALSLYFAALRSTTNPPSVPLPRTNKSWPNVDLSFENCPPAFVTFLQVWSKNVEPIQNLTPEHQHDLARVICGLDPIAQPINASLNRIAAELKAVAIDISQRRTFQDRYADDLQAALDAGEPGAQRAGKLRPKASFVPPPVYDSVVAPQAGPPPSSYDDITSPRYSEVAEIHLDVPHQSNRSRSLSASSSSTNDSYTTAASSSSSFTADAPAISIIRETLYASLADVLAKSKHIRSLLRRDPPRAYFAAVSLAVLDVAVNRTRMPESLASAVKLPHDESGPVVLGVMDSVLTLQMCPKDMRPFMLELCAIGARARLIEEDDSLALAELLQQHPTAEIPPPRIERARMMLERGLAAECLEDKPVRDTRRPGKRTVRRSLEGRSITFANRINGLALAMTKLRAFKERQDEVFKVLASAR